MLVKCPVCQTEYDLEPGKYKCKCGAKFFVDGSGVTAEISESSAIEGSDESIALEHRADPDSENNTMMQGKRDRKEEDRFTGCSEFADAMEGQNAKGANRKSGKGMRFALAGVIIVLAVIGIGYGCHQSEKAQRIAEEQRIAAERQRKAEEQRIAEEKSRRDLRTKAEQQAKREAESAAARNSASELKPDKNKTSTPKTAEPEQGMQNHGQYHADTQGTLIKVDNLLKDTLVMKQSQRKTFDKTYSVPFIVRAVCRTDGIALRFCLLEGEIFFKGRELGINVLGLKKGIKFRGKNGWSTVEIKVTASDLSVHVNGILRYTGKGNFENKKTRIELRTLRVGNNKRTISVNQLSVLTPVSSQTQIPVSQPQGAAQPASELNPDKNKTSTPKTAEPEQGMQNHGQYHADIQGLLKVDNLLKERLVMKQSRRKTFDKTYSVPFIVRAVYRTDGVALRFWLLGGEISLTRGNLIINVLGLKKGIKLSGKNGWSTVEIKVTASALSVYVNGELRYTGKGNFENKKSRIELRTLGVGNDKATISVDQLSVLTPGSSQPQVPVSQPQGAAQPTAELNPDKNKTGSQNTNSSAAQTKEITLQGNKFLWLSGKYTPPYVIRAKCKTNKYNLKFHFLNSKIIFNWERDPHELRVDIPGISPAHAKGKGYVGINTWADFMVNVLPNQISIYVNGELRYTGTGDFQNKESAVGIATNKSGGRKRHNNIVTVKDFSVETVVDLESISLPNNVKLEMVKIKAGSFIMGSPESESGKDSKEKEHRVTLTRGYWLGKYEVTQGQWKAVMETNPSSNKEGDNYPVEQVSWHDAKRFCEKLNERYAGKLPQGYRFDLPTEAQWEYACRAGTISLLNNAKNVTSKTGICPNLDAVGWYRENSSRTTHDYGKKRSNTWGLHDMHGNVWEWCSDWHGAYSGDATDPAGPSNGSKRIIRGGSWRCMAGECTSARRDCLPPYYRASDIGFRLAIVPVHPAPSSHKKEVKSAK